jgi:hypothetical protein
MLDFTNVYLTLACIVLLGSGSQAWEKDADSADVQSNTASIKKLIQDLESKDFKTRESATTELNRLGKVAVPALQAAALGDNREARGRAFGVLRKLFQSEDAETKAATKAALQQIADKDVPGISRQAALLLDPPKPPRQRGIGAQIQLRVQVGGGGRKVSIRTVNGVKEIDAEENGRKVHIDDDPQNGIKVKITEKNADGKEETKTYEAKNADDLKKKHPEAHKVYEKYSKGGGINVIQIGIPPQLPFRFPFRRIGNQQIDDLDGKVKGAIERLGKAAESDNPANEIAESLKLLEQVREQLGELRRGAGPGPALPKAEKAK